MRRKNRDQIKDLERRVKRLEEDVSFLSGIILIDHVRTIKNSPLRERWKGCLHRKHRKYLGTCCEVCQGLLENLPPERSAAPGADGPRVSTRRGIHHDTTVPENDRRHASAQPVPAHHRATTRSGRATPTSSTGGSARASKSTSRSITSIAP